MTKKKLSLFLAALVATVFGVGAFLLPAHAAEQLGTARGWCVKSSTGELRTLRLTTAGKCQAGYWGPISLASGVKGPAGPSGPKGDKGDPGEAGTAVLCVAGYTSRDIVIANAAKTGANAAALAKSQLDLAAAKLVLVGKEKAVEAADAAIVKAQAAVDAATTVAAKDAATKVLADAVVAKAAAVSAVGLAEKDVAARQADVDRITAEIAAPALYTVRTCAKG